MAKKHKDSWPVIDIICIPRANAFGPESNWTENYAKRRGEEMVDLIKRHCIPHFSEHADIEMHIKSRHVCEHCGWNWTEASPLYNGGCCEADEAANPELQVAP